MRPILPRDNEESYPNGHLSETIALRQWIRLLVVVSTCLLLVLSVGVGVALLSRIGHTLLLFSLGGLLAYALDPPVELLRSRMRWRRSLCVFAVFGVLALIVGGAAFGLSQQLVKQVSLLSRDHVTYEAMAHERLHSLDDWLESRNIHFHTEEYLNHPPPNVKGWGELVAQRTLKTLEALSKDIVEAGLVALIALYFLIYNEELTEGVDRALHPRLRPYVLQWRNDVNRILGGFVRGQIVLALTLGAAAAVGCLLLGIRVWLLIGLFVVVASLVPVFGPVVGAVPAVIAALVTPSGLFHPLVRAVLVAVLFVIINEIGSKVLYPRLVGRALGLHEVAVLFILLAGLEASGLTGVLFAAPLAALGSVTGIQLYRLWQGLPPVSVAQEAKAGGQAAKAEGAP